MRGPMDVVPATGVQSAAASVSVGYSHAPRGATKISTLHHRATPSGIPASYVRWWSNRRAVPCAS